MPKVHPLKNPTAILQSKFASSVDATEYFEKIQDRMTSHAAINWARMTDANYGTESLAKLREASAAFNEFLDLLHGAE